MELEFEFKLKQKIWILNQPRTTGSIIQLPRGSLAKLHAKGYHKLLVVRLDLDGPDLTWEGERARQRPSWRGGAMAEHGKSSLEFTIIAIPSTIRRADITKRMRQRW
jgi:hypothetical protein